MFNPPTLGPDLGVEIEVTQQNNTGQYSSRLLGANEEVIYLELPFENGLPVAVARDQPINVYFKGEGAPWYYQTWVQDVRMKPRPIIVVARPDELRRVKRRRYAREAVRITPKYFMLLSHDRGYPLQATIRNVGGGGVLFISPQQLPEGETVKMVFELPEGYGEVTALGKVVDSRPAPQFGAGTYAMGVAFTRIPGAHREAIIQFVLHCQTQAARARLEQTSVSSV